MDVTYIGGYAHPRSHRFLGKKPSARHRILALKLLVRGVPESPKSVQAITTALGCAPELDGKILQLKTPHTLTTGHG